jgi:hypothetical protein
MTQGGPCCDLVGEYELVEGHGWLVHLLTFHQLVPIGIDLLAGLAKEGGALLPVQVIHFPNLVLEVIARRC